MGYEVCLIMSPLNSNLPQGPAENSALCMKLGLVGMELLVQLKGIMYNDCININH